jgi:hypothetical protein
VREALLFLKKFGLERVLAFASLSAEKNFNVSRVLDLAKGIHGHPIARLFRNKNRRCANPPYPI